MHARAIIGEVRTYACLPNLAINVPQTLYTLTDSASMNIKTIYSFYCFVRVDVEGGVENMCIERGSCWWVRQILWVLFLPFLYGVCVSFMLSATIFNITISLSQPRKNVRTSAYLATGCRTTRPRYRSRSPRLASTKSSLKRPAYCFSGSGGSAIPGNRRINAVCSTTKCEKRL